MKLPAVLTIAGSDSIGGAGIQADLKTMLANGTYGMSAITALTAQNTKGIRSILEATPAFLADELDAIFEDIEPAAVKIGMVSSVPLIETIAQKLRQYQTKHIVLDPVMVATSGAHLIADEAVEALKAHLFPLAEVVTPNRAEAEVLSGLSIESIGDMLRAAERIATAHPGLAVLLKGGHIGDNADDLLYQEGESIWYRAPRIDNPNTHGTGCTLSSAIAAQLAKGHDLPEAVRLAKDYVTGTIAAQLDLGHASGPLHHGYRIPM